MTNSLIPKIHFSHIIWRYQLSNTPYSHQASKALLPKVPRTKVLGLKLVSRQREKLVAGKCRIRLKSDDDEVVDVLTTEGSEKSGSILGAVSLIVGTSIGSGILALPEKTSPAGFVPSAAAMIICWFFLLIEALLLAEVNVYLWRKMKKDEKDFEVISIRTMAQEMLGELGGNIATITYVFLAYTSIVAYTSMSGELLSRIIHLPEFVSGPVFSLLISLLILLGGTHVIDQVNQWLTVSMIGLLVAVEVIASFSSGWSGLVATSNWLKLPPTIPVIIFSLVYHDIAPVICAYLGGDLTRIRLSIVIGSLVPLLTLLIWDDILLGVSNNLDGANLLDLLVRRSSNIMLPMVETFSILAVGTSLIGTLLGFSEFFKEQLDNLYVSLLSSRTQGTTKNGEHQDICPEEQNSTTHNTANWWRSKKTKLLATSMAILPSALISTLIPDAFSTATDIAGGYCMTVLYGLLPPAMAWAMQFRIVEKLDTDDRSKRDDFIWKISSVKPILIGAGLFSCIVVVEQMLQDLFMLRF